MTMTLDPVASLAESRQRARDDATVEYAALVEAFARGGDVEDHVAVDAVLAAAGKTEDQLRGDVRIAAKRIEFVRTAATQADKEAALAEANAELLRLECEYKDRIDPLRLRQSELLHDLNFIHERVKPFLCAHAPAFVQHAIDACRRRMQRIDSAMRQWRRPDIAALNSPPNLRELQAKWDVFHRDATAALDALRPRLAALEELALAEFPSTDDLAAIDERHPDAPRVHHPRSQRAGGGAVYL